MSPVSPVQLRLLYYITNLRSSLASNLLVLATAFTVCRRPFPSGSNNMLLLFSSTHTSLPTANAGPFISYVELSKVLQVEQQLKQEHIARQQGGNSSTGAGIDWRAVGGRSLHQQQDVWGSEASTRHKRP